MKTASWQKVRTPKMKAKRNERRRRRRTDPLLQGPKKPIKGRFTMHAVKRALPAEYAQAQAINAVNFPSKESFRARSSLRKYIRALWDKLMMAKGGA